MDKALKISGFWQCLGNLWRMAGRDNLGRIVFRCLIGAVRIAASLAFVIISKRLVDIATGSIEADLGLNIACMVAVMLVQILNNAFSSYYEGVFLIRTENGLRGHFFSHVMHSRWNGREAIHSGDAVNRLETDIHTVADLVVTKLPDIIITVMQLICSSVILFVMKPGLLWVLVSVMVLALVSSRICFLKLRNLSADIRAKDAQIQSFMQENLLHRVLVLTLIGVDSVTSKMGFLQTELFDSTTKRLRLSSVSRMFVSMGFAAGYLSAFLWGVTGIYSGAVSFGMMTAFLQLVGQVQGPIAQISRSVPSLIHAMTSVDRLAELQQMELEHQADDFLMQGLPGIRINDVSFAYEAENLVLDGFSCAFQPGSMTAVMGPTGVGKSTLIRLILGLLSPQKGSVEIFDAYGSRPVSNATRCNFMYVPQGNSMMSGSVRENFLMANPAATQEEIEAALHLACADFVLDLPDGLDTVCSELGAGLSEGQAQRLAIARALLRKGQILILDESTSALDSDTEDRILADIQANLHGKRTIIFITHRQSVALAADAVVRLGK